MQTRITPNWQLTDLLVSIIVLIVLFWFTYIFLIRVPYAGFYFNPTNGQVVDIYVKPHPIGLLQDGDRINQIGDILWNTYKSSPTQSFFSGFRKDQIVNIAISRKDQSLSIVWVFPGFTVSEFKARFFNIWWLGYFFWFFGFLTQILIRPRNTQRRLLISANYLTGVWLVCGPLSGSHVGGGLVILRAVTWLMLPVYLNLHWYFPKPLFYISTAVWIAIYLIGCALALFELFQLLPGSFYALGFLLALLGSLILLIAHWVRQPSQRRDVGLLLMGILTAVIPSIGLGILYTLDIVPGIGALALLVLPLMPVTYFFVIYRHKLGGLELRANRIISIYSYLILLGTALLFLAVPAISLVASVEELILANIVVTLVIVFLSILLFPHYQSFVEQRLLGIRLPYQGLPETYSDRITTSTTLSSLLLLLDREVFPSLLVRQFGFFQISKGHLNLLLATGVTQELCPKDSDIDRLIALSGHYLSNSSNDGESFSWVRLILPLRIEGTLIGLWLFGHRDPDDLYSQAEIPILQSLSNQTAIALSNINQTSHLRTLYKENINRHEQERMRLALELHDGVLNQMAVLSLNLDPATVSPKVKEAYDGLTQQLRDIVSDLRPPLLQYGLKPAFEELAFSLTERSKGKVNVVTDMQATNDRYPESIELHVFRILQEAIENALHHAHAATIKIRVRLEPNIIELTIEDDGIGFEIGDKLELEDLLAKKHFGLAGIVERCRLIGAEMHINSSSLNGARLYIQWGRDAIQDRE